MSPRHPSVFETTNPMDPDERLAPSVSAAPDPTLHPDLGLFKAHGGMLTRPRVATAAIPLDGFAAFSKSIRQQGMLEACRALRNAEDQFHEADLERAIAVIKTAAVNLRVHT